MATPDDSALKYLLARYVETWNAHDMDAWGELFTDDVDYVNRAGGWWQGKRENVENHKSIHEMLRKQQTTYRASPAKINLLKPDIALVHATWEMTGFIGSAGVRVENFKGIFSMIVVKRNGKWLIRALQNTLT